VIRGRKVSSPPGGNSKRGQSILRDLGRLPEELERKGAVLVEEIKLPIEPLFGLNPDRFSPGPEVFYEIKLSLVSNRAVFSKEAAGLDREDLFEVDSRGEGTMKIDGASRLPLESLVEAGKVALEKAIGFFRGPDFHKAHFFDEPVLKNTKEPLNPSLGLGREGGNDSDREFIQSPLKLALTPPQAQELLFQAGLGRGAIRGMTIHIDRLREAVAAGVVKKTFHRGEGAFVIVETGEDPAGSVIDVTHKNELRPSPFEPIVVGPVHLDHFSQTRFPLPPLAVSPGSLPGLPESLFQKPKPERLSSNPDLFSFLKFLLGERGTETPVAGFAKPENFGAEAIGIAAIGGLSLEPVKDPPFPLETDAAYDSLDLTEGEAQKTGSLPLFELFIEGLLN
jgi:hypothetical protein